MASWPPVPVPELQTALAALAEWELDSRPFSRFSERPIRPRTDLARTDLAHIEPAMPTIVSCPKCRDQVTLPPEPYSGLICPHCQIEFSMQPTLRQPLAGPSSSLRQELAREARAGLSSSQRPGGEVALAEVGDQVIALSPRRPASALTVVCHVIGLLGGGALGLVAGYCLLTYWGGAHFNVLELPLPWLPPMTAVSPSDEALETPQAEATRPSGTAASPRIAPSSATPSNAPPSKDGMSKPGTAPPRSPTALPEPPSALAHRAAQGGPRLTAASHAETAAGAAAESSGAISPTKARPRGASRSSDSKHSLEELTRAASAARDALACPTCKSTGFVPRSIGGRTSAQRCPVCRGAAGTGITAEVYAKLCQLAEVATHADADDEDLQQARQVLAGVFRKAADRAEKRDAIGRHAAQRMTAPHLSPRSDAAGILLVGTIDRKESLGAYHATRLILLGEPSAVVVLSGGPMPLQPGERAIIAGSIVADPALDLPGYVGPPGAAVWGGMPVRLEE